MPKKIKYNPADRIADLAVVRMQDRIKEIYAEAERDISRKLDEFTRKFEQKDAQFRADVKAGKRTQAEYDSWRRGQMFQSQQWKAAKKEMTQQMYKANQTAAGIINGERRVVFQQNANYSAYQIEKDTKGAVNFELYDSATVTRLLKEDKKLLPEYKVNEKKDYKWNNTKVNNAVTQSIIQGESIPELKKRLTHSLEAGNRSPMMSFARTAMTGAQNAGRIEAMHDAEDMGIKVQKRWIATLDSRTRDTHAELDGQVVDVDEPFTVMLDGDDMEIMFPGDPNADPALVYNCRCTLGYEYPDVATGIGRRRDNETSDKIEGMTYKEWEKMKQGDGRYENGIVWTAADSNEPNIVYVEKPQYTDKEIDALHDYTTSSYSGINSLLREGGLENYPDAKRIVNKIDSAMDKSELASPITASRGERMNGLQTLFPDMKRSWLDDPEKLQQLEGKTASCTQFISTTVGDEVSEAYAGRGLVWHYEVEDGVKAIDMSKFASSNIRSVEHEVLIDRDVEVTIDRFEIITDSDGDIVGDVICHARIRGKHGQR